MAEKPKDESVIPTGEYCYSGISRSYRPCPYWATDPTKGEQNNGYCHFLGYGDWEEAHLSLLWDQVKSCGINMGDAE